MTEPNESYAKVELTSEAPHECNAQCRPPERHVCVMYTNVNQTVEQIAAAAIVETHWPSEGYQLAHVEEAPEAATIVPKGPLAGRKAPYRFRVIWVRPGVR